MNIKYFGLLFILVSFSALSAEKEKFSGYESNLKILEINYGLPYIKFQGKLEVKGTLVFRLDMLSETEFGAPLFADFIPIKDQLNMFPQVIEGRYPKSLDHVGIINIEGAYKLTAGESINKTNREIRILGTVLLENYSTTIECDSRQYFATLVEFKAAQDTALLSDNTAKGC